MRKIRKSTEKQIENIKLLYMEKLSELPDELISRTIDMFFGRIPRDREDKDVEKVFELMSHYAEDIKKTFISSGDYLTHVSDISPDQLRNRTLERSKDRFNNYNTEKGDWFFAGSYVEGTNPYVARKGFGDGMILIDRNAYIYGGDNFAVEKDEEGRSYLLLKRPNYIYKLNPKNFRPVVAISRDSKGRPFFDFSKEWITDEDISIDDKEMVLGIEEKKDVTEILSNFQVFSDVKNLRIAQIIKSKSSSKREGFRMLIDYINQGKVRYLNRETGINALIDPKEFETHDGIEEK